MPFCASHLQIYSQFTYHIREQMPESATEQSRFPFFFCPPPPTASPITEQSLRGEASINQVVPLCWSPARRTAARGHGTPTEGHEHALSPTRNTQTFGLLTAPSRSCSNDKGSKRKWKTCSCLGLGQKPSTGKRNPCVILILPHLQRNTRGEGYLRSWDREVETEKAPLKGDNDDLLLFIYFVLSSTNLVEPPVSIDGQWVMETAICQHMAGLWGAEPELG